jgi:hypothetical protein
VGRRLRDHVVRRHEVLVRAAGGGIHGVSSVGLRALLLDSDGQGTRAAVIAWLAPWLAEMEVNLIGRAMSLCPFIYPLGRWSCRVLRHEEDESPLA